MAPELLLERPATDTGPGVLYEQLAGRIEALIQAGTLAPGDRLPSVRKLREQFGVSISTVLEALRLLEDRGLVEARPQSGHYVKRRLRTLPEEPGRSDPGRRAHEIDVSLSVRLNRAIFDPTQKVQLGAAIPGLELLPLRTLNRLVSTITREHPEACHAYDAPPGRLELRHEIARRMLDAGVTVSPDEVVITNGTKEAVYLALQAVTKPGDTVAIESPTYYDLIEGLHSLHLRALPIATSPREGVCFDALGDALQKKQVQAVALTANFSNPLGTLMSDADKASLVKMLARYGVPLVEDDIYGDTVHQGPRPKALRAFDEIGDTVLYCASFSKTISPALRVGWCLAGPHQQKIEHAKRALNQSNSKLLQLVTAEYLKTGGYDRHLRKLRRAYREQTDDVIDGIVEHFPEGTRLTRPTGGHMLWVEMPTRVDSLRLQEDASAAGISIAPGPMFSVDGSFRNCVRLNTGLPWTPAVGEALAKLGALAKAQLA